MPRDGRDPASPVTVRGHAMRSSSLLAGFLTAALLPAVSLAHDPAHPAPRVEIEGPADAYVYELAAPGSYNLPRIKPAAGARLLDETGKALDLSQLFGGRLTVLAFMYTRCGDACPLAALRLADLQQLAAEDAAAARQVQILSLSFDPDHDTPAVMAEYGELMRHPDIVAPRWLFLTAPGQEALEPLLAAYDQPVARKADPDGPGGPLNHLLRVFLIDAEGFVRNIYSADFLDPRLLMNDLRTLQMETP
ncbi:MAG: SCO family protein [Kiloniellaceae bacterium]|nr:SCO family protein [Kiloniellaceae bacterium]